MQEKASRNNDDDETDNQEEHANGPNEGEVGDDNIVNNVDGDEDGDDENNGHDEDGDEDGSNEDENGPISMLVDKFRMNDDAWNAVENAANNKISKRKESSIIELVLPHLESYAISRYNDLSHYRFQSNDANENMDILHNSLVNCNLHFSPMGYSKESPTSDRIPFKFRAFNIQGFDVDGDLIAMCGDMYHNQLREEKKIMPGFKNFTFLST